MLGIDRLLKKKFIVYYLTAFLPLYYFDMNYGVFKIATALFLSLAVICSCCTIESMKTNWLFNLCGKYCLPIYLIHSYFTAGTRVILKHFHCSSIWLYFLTGIFLGIVIPILFYKFCMSKEKLQWIFKPSKFID